MMKPLKSTSDWKMKMMMEKRRGRRRIWVDDLRTSASATMSDLHLRPLATVAAVVILLPSLALAQNAATNNSNSSNNNTECPLSQLPSIANGQYIVSTDRRSVLYFCNEMYHFARLPGQKRSPILYCDQGTWWGSIGECIRTPCKPNPCLNLGRCSMAEDPFGTGYTCSCQPGIGGRRCQVVQPCSTCPRNSVCVVTSADDTGRFCYDASSMKLVA